MSILPAIYRDENLDRNKTRIWLMKVRLEHDEHQVLGISRLAQVVVTLVEMVVAAVVASPTCFVASGQVRAENVDDDL